jgi:hypothetical protein
MQLDRIAFLITYINGRVYDRSDDIIRDSLLYDYICRVLDRVTLRGGTGDETPLRECIEEVTADYDERVSGARRRLNTALEIIVVAYYASIVKRHSDEMTEKLING